jgi:hypothetical protein
MILINRIQTPDGTILTSRYTHDYQSHVDADTGHIYAVDGGREYLRRNGPPGYKELSVHDDETFETRREHLEWGNTMNEDNTVKPEIEWIKIKDLKTDHIENILKYFENRHMNPVYEDTFIKELEFRKK